VVLFVVRRIVWAAILVLVITLFTFVIFFVLPAAPLGRGQIGTEDVSIRDAYEFSGPIWQEYYQYVRGIFIDGSLGRSLSNRRDISEILKEKAPITGSLILGGMLLMLMIAVPIGILSALKPRSPLDRATMTFVLVGLSAHPAWIGLILAYFFAYRWQVFPIAGYCNFFEPMGECGGPWAWTRHLALPWLTFAVLLAAFYARMIRASVLETSREDYVRTARAKGAPERRVLRSHVLRNGMLPVVTMLSLGTPGDAGFAFGGIIFIERVFGLPGLGGMMLEGLNRRDPPLVLGVVVFVSVAIVILNLIVDIVYTMLDPRVRESQGVGRIGLRRRYVDEPEPARVAVGSVTP
jgi:peptide/nickel transport system permease protein